MGRRRIHADDAARSRAYRERRKSGRKTTPVRPPLADDARAVVDWARAALVVPPGHAHAGRPFRIADWQSSIIADALRYRETLVCVARKNAKSALIAILVLAYLAGPLRRPGWRCGVLSASREKAGELLAQVDAIRRASALQGLTLRRSPWPGRMIADDTGAVVEIEGAGNATGHAAGYDVAIVDEIGLLAERHRPQVAGMRSSGAAKGGRFIALSIHGPGPFVPEILAREGADGLAVHHYHGSADLPLDDPANWAMANPGLADGIVDREALADEARRVLDTPSDQAYFRAHRLNLPGEAVGELIASVESWRGCEVADLPPRTGPAFLGIDLGATKSFTSGAAYWPDSGRLEVWTACPDTPSLAARARHDAAGGLYARAHAAGDLWPLSGRLTPVRAFLARLRANLAGEPVKAIGADRFRHAELVAHLSDLGLQWRPVWRGAGANSTMDAARDIRRFQVAVEGGHLRTRPNILIVNAIGESHIVRDAEGRAVALRQARQRARIDPLQAAVIAVGLAPERRPSRGRIFVA